MAAFQAISHLYDLSYPELEAHDKKALDHFGWIPNELMNMLGANAEVRPMVFQAMVEKILPLPPLGEAIDEAAWTNRMLHTMSHLEDRNIPVFLGLTGLSHG